MPEFMVSDDFLPILCQKHNEFSCRYEARYVGKHYAETSRQNKTTCPHEHQEEK